MVVVDPADAYHKLAPPFLNRFEKHRLDWQDVLPSYAERIKLEVILFLIRLVSFGSDFSPDNEVVKCNT